MTVSPFIIKSRAGIGTSLVENTTALKLKSGNLSISDTGTGIVFPDGTFQTSASSGGGTPGGTSGAIQYNSSGVFTGDTSKFSINTTTGNVGIGTSSPNNKLEVIGNSYLNGTVTSGTLRHNPVEIAGLLLAYDGIPQDRYGMGCSITPDGGLLAVGADRWEGSTGTDRGCVYIYEWNGSAWTQRGSVLQPSDAADSDWFGGSVSLSAYGSVLAVGANGWEGSTGTNRGGAYIYDWNGSDWVQRGSVIEAVDGANFDYFAMAVSLNSDASILAIGASYWEGAAGSDRGGVYIYDWNGSAWVQRGSVLEASDSANNDQFGCAVSLNSSGTVLAVGAQAWEGSTGTDTGGVYIYDWNGSAWVQRGSVLTASDAADSDQFGWSVSLNSDATVLAVGAPSWEGSVGGARGGVYIYDWNGSAWVQRGPVLEAATGYNGDFFGLSVALNYNGSILMSGLALPDSSGGVYTYSLTGASPGVISVFWGAGWVEATKSNLTARTSGLDRVTIISNGNVGIGTTLPGYTLDVSGTGHFTGNLTLDTDLTVQNGGTGQSSFTSNGVLYGNGSGSLQVTTQGGANTVLVANAGAPAFSSTPLVTSLTTTGVINAGGSVIVGSLTSNGTITGTTITGSTGFEGGSVSGTVFNARTSLIAQSITSNTSINSTTGFEGGAISGTVFNARTSLIAPVITSNGTITGTTITGSTGFEGGSVSGTVFNARTSAIVGSLTSNAGVSGTTGTFSTSTTTPTVFGGTAASSSLTLQSTSGAGTSDSIVFKTGNAGAVQAMTINTTGNVGIGTTNALYRKFEVWDSDALINGVTVGEGFTKTGDCVAVGQGALAFNTRTEVTAVGAYAGASNTTGAITAFGSSALSLNTTGGGNSAFGRYSLTNNTTGSNNSAFGYSAMQACTTGSTNSGFGYLAFRFCTTGNSNTGVGNLSFYRLTTGNLNTATGHLSGNAITTGSNNTCIGAFAGSNITIGSNNTVLGAYTGLTAPISQTGNNWVVLSDGVGTVRQVIDPNGNVGIGTTNPSSQLHVSGDLIVNNATVSNDLTVQGTIFETSDINLKTNIDTIQNSIDKVTKLRGVDFDWKVSLKHSSGVIAQEVESVLPHLINEDQFGNKTVNYNGLIGVLIEAIKDLKLELDKIKN